MPTVRIRSQPVNIDIRSELEAFEFTSTRWSSDKLIAASPFRYDKTPSFYVNLEGEYAGVFGDSGAYDADYASGGIVKLLAFLRNETYEETEDYLLEAYGFGDGVEKQRLIVPRLSERKSFTELPADLIEPLTSPYLNKRGISAEAQARAGVGRSKHAGFVAIPWYLPDGRLANVKYRATRGKTFFYEKGAEPIRNLVYGANLATDGKPCVICEAEIDALSWMTAGYNAVAVGGVAFNRKQAEIVKMIQTDYFVVAGDNDKAGQRFNDSVVSALKGASLRVIRYTDDRHKDANDVLRNEGTEGLRRLIEGAVEVPKISVWLR